MPALSYRQPGLVLGVAGGGATLDQIRDLQRDLRRLGYLKSGIDGRFGSGTRSAVRALQRDLLENDGSSTGGDGPAPVRVLDYNGGRVSQVTGEADQNLVECISDILDDAGFPQLPLASDPVQENQNALSQIAAIASAAVPIPFLLAIFRQESGLKHFNEPRPGDEDTFIVTGLDRGNSQDSDAITSRGYGIGQFTLFHHPPQPEEVTGIMRDPVQNVQKAIAELRDKFDHFVAGSTPGTRADDRQAEYGDGPLRLCKYDSQDARYMRDCKTCAAEAGTQTIQPGTTPLYPGSGQTYQLTPLYKNISYEDVPIRANIGCDWPYAGRRYNGSGPDSYNYQVLLLKHLLNP